MKYINKSLLEIKKLVLFTYGDINHYFSSKQQTYSWINNQLKTGQIIRIRNDLYSVVDQTTGKAYANKFLIGSNINKDAYLAYHSALEYYGLANQSYNVIYVCSSKQFRNFTFEGITYYFIKNSNKQLIDSYDYGAILKVTSKERTIIDSINNINLSGGIEEVMNALSILNGLNETNILACLKIYNKDCLYNRVGYLLSFFKDSLDLSEDFFNAIREKISHSYSYFLKNSHLKLKINNEWMIIAPTKEDLNKLINGGL